MVSSKLQAHLKVPSLKRHYNVCNGISFEMKLERSFFPALSFCVLTTFTKLNVKFIRVYPYLTHFRDFLFFFFFGKELQLP